MLPIITIEGRLVADPDLRFTSNNRGVANVRVGANDSRKLDDGTWENLEQIFVNVPMWNTDRAPQIAETTAETFKKGDRVIVTGKIYQREYEHNGEKRTSLEMKWPTLAKVVEAPRQNTGWSSSSTPASPPASDPWATTATGTDEPPF